MPRARLPAVLASPPSSRARALVMVGALAIAGALGGVPAAAHAQWRANLEVSGAQLRLDSNAASGAVTVGGGIARTARRYDLDATGLTTLGGDGRRTNQALASAALLGAPGGAARWSLGVSGSAFTERGSDATLSGYVVARERLRFAAGGAWLGAAVGGVRDRGDDFGVRTADAGLWRTLGTLDGRVSASLIDTRAAVEVPNSEAVLVLVTTPATYTDAAAELRWSSRGAGRAGAMQVGAQGGMRFIARGAARGDPTRKPFGGVDASVALGPRVLLSAAFGRELADLARGTPASRFVAVGLRLVLGGEERAPRRVPEDGVPRVFVERDSAGAPSLVVAAVAARRVEVIGTLTGWEPQTLASRDGRWVLARALATGTHRLLVRVDDGAWQPPANLPAVDDGDGGKTGLLVVP